MINDSDRLFWLVMDIGIDRIGNIDIHELAAEYKEDPGRSENLRAIQVAITTAMINNGVSDYDG